MAKPARSLMDLPELAGWLTFGEAATELGISVERVRQLASEPNPQLRTAHRIGKRPLGVVREVEIQERKRAKAEELARRAAEAAERLVVSEGAAELRVLRAPGRGNGCPLHPGQGHRASRPLRGST